MGYLLFNVEIYYQQWDLYIPSAGFEEVLRLAKGCLEGKPGRFASFLQQR